MHRRPYNILRAQQRKQIRTSTGIGTMTVKQEQEDATTCNIEQQQKSQEMALEQLTKKKERKPLKVKIQTLLHKKSKAGQKTEPSSEEGRNESDDTQTTSRGSKGDIQTENSTDDTPRDADANLKTSTSNGSGTLFGLGDKRQKKVVFTKISEDPKEAIEIQVDSIPEPASENHVVVKVTASTVSLQDCLIRKGVSYETVDLPITPGVCVVGIIKSVGGNVKKWKAGDRCVALTRFSGNARYSSILEANLVSLPRSVDASEASCLISSYMTAYQSLKLVTNDNFSLDGKCVLITGVLDSVGQALVQLCQRAGASEIYATAPAMRHKYVQGVLGVHPLPPESENWPELVKGRMDAVFDGTCQTPYDALSSEGILISLGESELMNQESSPGVFGAPISAYWARVKGNVMPNTHVYDLWDSFIGDKNAFKMDFEILVHLLKKRLIKPHIAKRISLDEVVEAHASLEKESPRGEIVCLPWKRSTGGKKGQTKPADQK
ncbi:MAG: hypothetical protein SGILL_001811 [Bacillariaceae sp.]